MRQSPDIVIRAIVNRLNAEKNKGIPTAVGDIQTFPFTTFTALVNALDNGDFSLFKYSSYFDADTFNKIATPLQAIQSTVGILTYSVGALLCFISGFFLGWWLFALVPVMVIVGLSVARSAYLAAIFRASRQHEVVFCFLYFVQQVGIIDNINGKSFVWSPQDRDSKVYVSRFNT